MNFWYAMVGVREGSYVVVEVAETATSRTVITQDTKTGRKFEETKAKPTPTGGKGAISLTN